MVGRSNRRGANWARLGVQPACHLIQPLAPADQHQPLGDGPATQHRVVIGQRVRLHEQQRGRLKNRDAAEERGSRTGGKPSLTPTLSQRERELTRSTSIGSPSPACGGGGWG